MTSTENKTFNDNLKILEDTAKEFEETENLDLDEMEKKYKTVRNSYQACMKRLNAVDKLLKEPVKFD